jgi:hypothetical protein
MNGKLESEVLLIRCPYLDCDPRWVNTRTTLFQGPADDPTVLIWLTGGNARSKNQIELSGLIGKRRMLVPANPYELKTYGKNNELVPEAFTGDPPTRVLSLIKWALSQKYKVFLGGHSNGGPRIVGFLSKYSNYREWLRGVIFSSAHVGKPPNFIPVNRVEWNIPVMIMHHLKDHSYSCRPDYQRWLYKNIKNNNKKSTELITLKTTTLTPDIDYDGTAEATHHMFRESQTEAAEAIDNFIKKNSD